MNQSQSQKPRQPRRNAPPPPPEKPRRKFPFWTLPVIVLCACLLAGAYVYADGQLANYDKFNAMRAAIAGDTIFGPVYVDGVSLNGLTMEQAREALSAPREEAARAFAVYVTGGGSTWRISSDEVPMEWNTEILLQKAYMIGRAGSLEDRFAQVKGITAPVEMQSEFTYDRAAVRKLTDEIALKLITPSKDATVVAFDVAQRTFTFEEETPGQTVDRENLYASVIDALDRGQYSKTITAEIVPVEPLVTRATLERNYTRIASFTTNTTKDDNRNTNIRLAADALNGRMIEAGGSLSFNETTGQRTRDKGYKEAGAIENGRTIQEVGGGVCQVSTTLFNALARAGGEIVNRKPHAWPSDYVPRGEDATVDWPNLDLVMKNPTTTPMFLTAWYEDRTITVEVYGLSLGDGVSLELKSDTTYEKKPDEVVYTYNANLAIGTTKLLKKPHTGYTVETYRIRSVNGQEVSRELFYTSNYRTINEEYEYNDGKPPATN